MEQSKTRAWGYVKITVAVTQVTSDSDGGNGRGHRKRGMKYQGSEITGLIIAWMCAVK